MHIDDKEGQTYGGGTQEKALPQQTRNWLPCEPHQAVMAQKLSGTCILHM